MRTVPAHACYVISTTRLTRIRGEAGVRALAYRERKGDSDFRPSVRARARARFAVVVEADGRFWISLNRAESKTRASTKDRRW